MATRATKAVPKKIPQAAIKIPQEPPAIDTPDWLPTKLHTLTFAAAAKGSGMSIAVSNLLRMYKEADKHVYAAAMRSLSGADVQV